MAKYEKYLSEVMTMSDDERKQAEKELIEFLQKMQKDIPKAIKEVKQDRIGMHTSNVIHRMASADEHFFYDFYWR